MSGKLPLFLVALLGAASLSVQAASLPYGTVQLEGGCIQPVSASTVRTSSECLNFCYATAFSDGSVYLGLSEGIHTVTEHCVRSYSLDKGDTWQNMECWFNGFNAYETLDHRKCRLELWDYAGDPKDTYSIKRIFLNPDGQSINDDTRTPLKMPFVCTACCLHRDVQRLKSGRLLQCGYGRKKGAPKWFSFVIASDDDGETWSFLSVIMEDLKEEFQEGPTEASVVELENGELLAFVRVQSNTDLRQLRSKDGGKSWGEPELIAPFCVNSSAHRLQNGTLVVITGRPNLYLLVDFTGTGTQWQRWRIYNGSGSSYGSAIEIEPNRLLIVYDESNFGTGRAPGMFSYVHAIKVDVLKGVGGLAKSTSSHPEGANYTGFYSPADGELPNLDNGNWQLEFYQKKSDENATTWMEIQEIAERPHPVLHLVHHGTSGLQLWPHIYTALPEALDKVEAGFELRLDEAAQNRPQFMVNVALANPNGGGQKLNAWVEIGNDFIWYENGGDETVKKDITYKFTPGFHAFILRVDAVAGTYALYEKGASEPLFTAKLFLQGEGCSKLVWGDGSGSVFGTVDLSYIGWHPVK